MNSLRAAGGGLDDRWFVLDDSGYGCLVKWLVGCLFILIIEHFTILLRAHLLIIKLIYFAPVLARLNSQFARQVLLRVHRQLVWVVAWIDRRNSFVQFLGLWVG